MPWTVGIVKACYRARVDLDLTGWRIQYVSIRVPSKGCEQRRLVLRFRQHDRIHGPERFEVRKSMPGRRSCCTGLLIQVTDPILRTASFCERILAAEAAAHRTKDVVIRTAFTFRLTDPV